MGRLVCMGVAMATVALAAQAAVGQIESHAVPGNLPAVLFPYWVLAAPPFESQETSATPPAETAKSAKGGGSGARAGPGVTSLAEMAKEPREAIQLAEGGKFREAAAAGTAVLRLPREQFRDFTWDYVGNATAWAYVQMENLPAAADTHIAAGQRIVDPALAEYHKIAAGMLGRPDCLPSQVKSYAAYQAELRKALQNRLDRFRRDAAPGQKIEVADVRLRHIRDAYEGLRVLTATDPEVGKQEQGAFRECAKGLVRDVIPAQLKEGRQIPERLTNMARLLHHSEFDDWDATVRALWAKVQYIKRLCRMYDYLVRKTVADPADTTGPFVEAHRLLFVPNDAARVWQEIARVRTFNEVSQEDLRTRVPYRETRITPWGVAPSKPVTTLPYGWQPIDDPMRNIDGKMGPMKPMKK